MPRKVSCALIGPGKGPYVRTRTPGKIRVRGLPEGEKAIVGLNRGEHTELLMLEENGDHAFDQCLGLSVAYDGRSKTFNAMVETEG